jgi:type VII secretion integral membrane protein EccD
MTTVRPASPLPAPAPGDASAVPASARVSVLVGDSHQIDVVLPASVPLSALTDATVDTVNKVLRGRGATELPPGAYEFARAAGMTALTPDLSLTGHGIADGELLALVPARSAQRYGPVVENVSTALARYATEHFPMVSAQTAMVVAAGITGTALATAAVIVWRMRWATDGALLASLVFGVATVFLVGTAMLCARLDASRVVVDGAAWAGVVPAALAGATLPHGAHPGAPHAFLASWVAGIGAVVVARFTVRNWAPAAAVLTVVVATIGASAVRMFWTVPGPRIALAVLLGVLIAVTAAPTMALRMARVPRQSFGSITGRDIFARAPGQPEDTVSPVESAPHDITLRGEQVAEVARRSNTVLTGVLTGIGVVAFAASICAISPGRPRQWPQVVVVATVALILVLRARAFRDRRHAIIVVVAAALSLIAIPAHYGLAAAPSATRTELWAAGLVLAVAAAALLVGMVAPSHIFSPPVREAVEYLEYVLLALVVPFAAWAIGLLHYIRYH